MKNKQKHIDEWKEKWIKARIIIGCPKHSGVKRTVLLNDYSNALWHKSRKKMWFCKKCGRRLIRRYLDNLK